MTLQYTIVFTILLLAIAYIAHRIRQTVRETRSGCYGCKGCALKAQIMKKKAKSKRKGAKNECFKKKD